MFSLTAGNNHSRWLLPLLFKINKNESLMALLTTHKESFIQSLKTNKFIFQNIISYFMRSFFRCDASLENVKFTFCWNKFYTVYVREVFISLNQNVKFFWIPDSWVHSVIIITVQKLNVKSSYSLETICRSNSLVSSCFISFQGLSNKRLKIIINSVLSLISVKFWNGDHVTLEHIIFVFDI